ncbi:MAG: hypothetical protein RI957_1164 [Verrucomicrobiota bacterium]|jgi:hypothetical protein
MPQCVSITQRIKVERRVSRFAVPTEHVVVERFSLYQSGEVRAWEMVVHDVVASWQ